MQRVTCPACGAETAGEAICPVCGMARGGSSPAPVRVAPAPPAAPAERVAPASPAPPAPGGGAARPAPPRSDWSPLVGEVRGLRERSEQGDDDRPRYIVTFRVERHDADGAALAPVPVEIRGRRLEGVIQDGDWVELPPGWRPGQTLRLKGIRNVSTGSTFGAKGDSRAVTVAKVIVYTLVLAFIAAIFVLVVVGFLSEGGP